ncbi:MAG: DUF2191 domain-containing protein [Gammaproteobacteria bacterium]|nr:DUF2191 domain-containing protein [Gammaproteobacteria bacterium]
MRTTLTLDDDVLESARLLAAETRKPFKTVVNEALREGLNGLKKGVRQRPYVTTPRAMGLRPGHDLDNIQELIAQVEGESAR